MNEAQQMHSLTHCFCEISDDELAPWVAKRYVQNIPTIDLLLRAKDSHEKELISIVALFDVDDATMLKVMRDVTKTERHKLACRLHVKELLEIPVP